MRRILVITHEPLRQNLSGPGIRALEIARLLGEHHAVTLATPFPPEITDPRCVISPYSFDAPQSLKDLAAGVSVMIVQGFTLSQFPFLAEMQVPIVVDLYCPFTIEHLEMITSRPGAANALAAAGGGQTDAAGAAAMAADAAGVLAVQNTQLVLGDFFLCASERQRDFWIGALHTAGRINPRTYAADPTLRSLIDVVPFGVNEPLLEPQQTQPVLKGVRSGIRASDHVLLWAGSILDWQDPQTLVRAVASIAGRRPDVKLFFMGTKHPNPVVAPMRAVAESIALARELGVLDTHVIFNDWVPYTDRWRYLREADLGLSTHREHLETRLSFRTRMLDYLWSGLPIVCTGGDVFAALVAEAGSRRRRPSLETSRRSRRPLSDDRRSRRARAVERLLEVAEEFRWRRVVAPLARFCADPRRAPDWHATAGQRKEPGDRTHGHGVNRWLKRKALALGVSPIWIDSVKGRRPVRWVLRWINRLTRADGQRGAAAPPVL